MLTIPIVRDVSIPTSFASSGPNSKLYRMNPFYLNFWVICIVLMSCGDGPDGVEHCTNMPGDLNIRVQNLTDKDFDKVIIITSEWHDYGAVASGEITCYENHEEAYRYAYVKAIFGSDSLIIQPIDYVGETPLSDGYWTYNLENAGNGLNIFATED